VTGGISVDELDLDVLCGEAQVVELVGVAAVTADLLAGVGIRPETKRLLLKTGNSSFWENDLFRPDFAALTKDAAQFLVGRGIRLVGVDYLSVQRYNDPPDVHRLLLEEGVVLVEGLDLSRAASGHYELICLPLRIVGAEGALARAILRELR
jgi:arylformamidase